MLLTHTSRPKIRNSKKVEISKIVNESMCRMLLESQDEVLGFEYCDLIAPVNLLAVAGANVPEIGGYNSTLFCI